MLPYSLSYGAHIRPEDSTKTGPPHQNIVSKRNAVFAVMDLLPSTISLIPLGGTERSLENRLMLMPNGSRKSPRTFASTRLVSLKSPLAWSFFKAAFQTKNSLTRQSDFHLRKSMPSFQATSLHSRKYASPVPAPPRSTSPALRSSRQAAHRSRSHPLPDQPRPHTVLD